MRVKGQGSSRKRNTLVLTQPYESRLRLVTIGVIIFVVIMILRLFSMQVIQHTFYTALASGTHDLYRSLLPSRGSIFVRDANNPDDLYPLAMNRNVYQLFIDNRENPDPEETAVGLAGILGWDADTRFNVFLEIDQSASDDPYIPISHESRVSEEHKQAIDAKEFPGVYFVRKPYRFFPEGDFASHVLGFYGLNSDGQPTGLYGIEGYHQELLAGDQGFIEGERDAFGAWIPVATRSHKAAKDGTDVVLTIDRVIQNKACDELENIAIEVEAQQAAAVIMDPKTGAIKAMCSWPTFDPNIYNEVEGVTIYNNQAIFTAYEPGSVFKTVTMAAALDKGVVTPELTFDDPGSVKLGQFTIRNALQKSFGNEVSMTKVLEESINTGMIFVVDKLGNKDFAKYVRKFGFGEKSGIELDTEVAGNVDSLDKDGDIYAATGSFGQGLTATPLQLASAYAAMANNGIRMQPYIVEEIRHADGTVHVIEPREVERVISSRAANLISGMLTSVIEQTYKRQAGVEGYHLGGKTGTAQIPGPGGYTEETNHTFVGYGPTEDPQFVILSKFEKPARRWSSQSAAPYFGRMAKFLVQYLSIPPSE